MKQTLGSTPDENDDVNKKEKPRKSTAMFMFFREIFLLLIVSITVYATIISTQQKTRKGAPSSPFLGVANVDDFYQGDLSQLTHEISSTDYSFVFFYAPWDADSQDLKYQFLEAVELYSKWVYFAAVNCWEPGSECRKRFKDVVERYPQLVAYVGLERAVVYKGPPKADHIIKFLHSVIHPIVRLNTVNDLWKLRSLHDAVVVGHLRVQGRYKTGLNALYETALSLASRDHTRRTALAVFTHAQYNAILGVNATPTIVLYVGRKKIRYSGRLTKDELYKWVTELVGQEVELHPDRPLALPRPALLMFTPLHPLAPFSSYYLMMQRIAKGALQNVSSASEGDFIQYNAQFDRALQARYQQELVEENAVRRVECAKLRLPQVCQVQPRWINQTCRLPPLYQPVPLGMNESERLNRLWTEMRCRLLDRAPHPAPILSPSINPTPTINVSFSFACLDADVYSHIALGLGIDLNTEPYSTAVVLIGQEEMVKVRRVRENVIWSELKQWAAGKRRRTVRSESRVTPPPQIQSDRVLLPELNMHQFLQLTTKSQQNSVILYHSRYCGSCARASHILLELVSLLHTSSCLSLARVDGDTNDLPWHFTLHVFPSLLFLPAKRKSESRIFPENASWSLNTVSKFIVANLKVEERPEVMLALCARWGNRPEETQEGLNCVKEVRSVSLEGIASRLRQYRLRRLINKSDDNLLHHLSFLKTVHLTLVRVTDIQLSLQLIQELSNKFQLGCVYQ